MQRQNLSEVNDFLKNRRIAIIGVSRNEKEYSRLLMKGFIDNKFDVVPINRNTDEIDGIKCFPSIGEVDPPVASAVIVLEPIKMLTAAKECVRAGVKNVWLYGVIGPKQVGQDVIDYLIENDVNVVAGYCPFMFLDDVAGFHKFHKLIWKLIGFYPKK